MDDDATSDDRIGTLAVGDNAKSSGTSSLDGQSIATISAAALVEGTYAAQVRAAVAARGTAVMEAIPKSGSTVTLKSVLDEADARTSAKDAAAPVSTHINVTFGNDSQQYVLALSPPETGQTTQSSSVPGTANVYVVMDPALFHPKASTGEDTYPRDVPATKLSTGQSAVVTLREDGFSVAGDATGQLLVIEAVPVIEQINEEYPDYYGFGEPLPATELQAGQNGFATSYTFLALRSLRIDRSFDGGGVSGRNEVQFTAQPTDNYSLEIPRYNTRRFDNAFWTVSSDNPRAGGSNTLNPVYMGGGRSLWFQATDVDYAGRDYPFGSGSFFECIEGRTFPARCEVINQAHDFPIIQITSSNTYFRAYMNEDDLKVDRMSRRAGDWRGNIRTINFSTGNFETLNTRVDANNHAVLSSDQVFTQSGIRRVNGTTVSSRTVNGSIVYNTDSNGLKYSFTRQTITIP